jgi:hypothetical protein
MRLGMFMHRSTTSNACPTLLREDLDVIRPPIRRTDEVWLGEHYLLPSGRSPRADALRAAHRGMPAHHLWLRPIACQLTSRIIAAEGGAIRPSRRGLHDGVGPGAAPPDFRLFDVLDKDHMAMLEKRGHDDSPMDRGPALRHSRQVLAGGRWTTSYPISASADDRALAATPTDAALDGRNSGALGWRRVAASLLISANLCQRKSWPATGRLLRGAGAWPPNPAVEWRAGRTLLVTETDEEARDYLRTPTTGLDGISSTSAG